MLINEWSLRDKKAIWHPYTQIHGGFPAIPIVKGEGSYLYTDDGRKLIDAISSWWVNIHGHGHPYIAEKLHQQFLEIEHVLFAGFTHPPAIQLAERILDLLPLNQKKAFYSDNGSTAVEVALKMCIQYWHNKGEPRKKILAFKDAYHGDTFGAMSVSGRSVWTAPFESMLFEVCFVETPHEENMPEIKAFLAANHAELACFIYEPLVQGSAGMLMHEAQHLDELMQHCRKLGVLLVQDEVFTGFGRTGRLFAACHLKQQPDVMCFSKGLTGGVLPLGLTTCTDTIHQAFISEDRFKTLFHGHSFTANPLACAAALASLDLLLSVETQHNIGHISEQHDRFARSISNHKSVKAVRTQGTILAIEWETGEGTSYFSNLREILYNHFLEKGILLRPLGNIIYVLPPYCISDTDLNYIYRTIALALDKFKPGRD